MTTTIETTYIDGRGVARIGDGMPNANGDENAVTFAEPDANGLLAVHVTQVHEGHFRQAIVYLPADGVREALDTVCPPVMEADDAD